MKKTLLLFTFILFARLVFAPSHNCLTIIDPDPVKPYEKLIYAIGMTETKCDTLAFNAVEEAVGYFQIRPIRLRDYNERTGNSLKIEEMFDYKKAEKVFLHYADEIGPYNFELIARNWNGSGKQTVHYWNRVKQYL